MNGQKLIALTNTATEKVNALSNLTADQRAKVLEMATGYIHTNEREPHYENLANLVRSFKS
jgi:hypothetical protein